MKKVLVRNRSYSDPAINWDRIVENAEDYLQELKTSQIAGKPERWVPASEAHDPVDVLETEQREVRPAEGEQLAVMQEWVKLRAEYTVEIEDISEQLEQERINREALEYLASTDWLIIREIDAGVACPVEIKQARAEARARIVR
jgi:vacuolar-type H+-ATPase subunit I/STV1